MQYLQNVRCKQAMILLDETNQTLTQIAMECGFGSSQSFARAFRKVIGMTPSQYRSRRQRKS